MPKISILLSTYNGSRYLRDQLDSLRNQTYKDFEIIARDDVSSDGTLEMLKSYDIKFLESERNLGAKGSFSELLYYAAVYSDSDYFMFCDQDDVWGRDKIEKTITKMQEMEKKFGDAPLLVHTDLEVVDENMKAISISMWEYEHINPSLNSLNRLLIHNTITGCTMMINRELAKLCLPIPKEAIMHDWWIGLVASSFGRIDYLAEPTMKYRQHSENDTGAKKYSYKNIVIKAWHMFFGKEAYAYQSKKNIIQARAFLEHYDAMLTNGQKEMLKDFSEIESKSFFGRKMVVIRHGLWKYGLVRNIGLLLRI